MSKYVGKIITNQAPAGYSVFFDGTGDNLSLGTAAALNFGTSNFTVEFWYYPTAIGINTTILASGNATFGSGAVVISGGSTTANAMRFGAFDFGGTYQIVADPAVTPTNTWTHYALTRSGNTFTLYRNGVSVATNTWAGSVNFNSNSSTKVGGGTWDGAPSFITGNISNLRAINGTALYTANFAPPTQLLNITNTSLLTCNSPAIVDQSSNAFAITVNGNSAVSTFTPFTAYVPYNPSLGASTPGVWTLDEAMQAAATRQWNMYDPNFQNTTLLLHGNGTNAAQNNTFLDSSTNNFTITRNGNTTQGSFSPFSQTGWSNFFNGTNSDVLEVPNNVAFDFGTSDVTVETWVYLNSTSAIQNLIDVGPSSGSGFTSWTLDITASGFIRFGSYVSGTYQATEATSNALLPNQWYHIAFTRSAGTNRLFVNGVVCAATGTFTQAINSGGNTLMIGRGKYSGFTRPTTGYFSSVRIVKGTAVYTNNFTPSAVPLTAISGTSLLTCQSNRFVDNSTNNFTITPTGTPSVQAFSPFYPTAAYTPATIGGSGYFDGTGDYLTVADNASLEFGSSNFTLEYWIYQQSTTDSTTYWKGTSGQYGPLAILMSSSALTIYMSYAGSTWDATITSSVVPALNAWNHIAVVRNGSTVTLYVNGVSRGTASVSTNSLLNSAASIGIGAPNTGGAYQLQGYLSNYRIVIGSAVYTANFTPPTSPVTAITNTQLLLNFTNAGVVDSTAKNVLETVGNAQISTTQSKFGGGSMYFDGTGDYLVSNTATPDLYAFGTGNFTIEFWVRYASTTGIQVLYDGRPSGTQGAYPTIYSTGGSLRYYTNTSDQITGSTLSANVWYHIAVSRSGTSTKLFIDGTQSGSTYTDSTNYLGAAGRPSIGDGLTLGSYPFNGYIDDLRVTKGFARYTANFTPQTSQWQDQ